MDDEPLLNEEQYGLVFERRLRQNDMVWQTPGLATAALAFLLAAGLNPEVDPKIGFSLSFAAVIVSLASLQLMAKHRHLEINDAELLAQFEVRHSNGLKPYLPLHQKGLKPSKRANWFVAMSSFKTWIFVLVSLGVLSGYGVVHSAMSIINQGSSKLAPPASPQESC